MECTRSDLLELRQPVHVVFQSSGPHFYKIPCIPLLFHSLFVGPSTPHLLNFLMDSVGLKLNKLRKHDDKSVSEKATSLYKKWRMHFKEQQDKPKIEVRTDNDTKKYRSAGRKLIEDILNPHKVCRAFL